MFASIGWLSIPSVIKSRGLYCQHWDVPFKIFPQRSCKLFTQEYAVVIYCWIRPFTPRLKFQLVFDKQQRPWRNHLCLTRSPDGSWTKWNAAERFPCFMTIHSLFWSLIFEPPSDSTNTILFRCFLMVDCNCKSLNFFMSFQTYICWRRTEKFCPPFSGSSMGICQ